MTLFTPVLSEFFFPPSHPYLCFVFHPCWLGFFFFSFGFMWISVDQGRLYIATFTTVSTINKMPVTQDKPKKAWILPGDLPDLDTNSDSETSEDSFWDYKGSDGSSQTEYLDLEDEESDEEEEEEEEEEYPDSGDESDDESEVPKAGYKYKKVADKVWPQAIKYPEHLKPHRQFPSDPLKNLPTLPYHPPIFSLTPKITSEQMADLAIDQHSWNWVHSLPAR